MKWPPFLLPARGECAPVFPGKRVSRNGSAFDSGKPLVIILKAGSARRFRQAAIFHVSLVTSMKKIWIIAGLILVAGALCTGAALLYILPLDSRDRSPVQPIAFSHKVHAGDNGIPCLFCHRSGPKSPVAGIPAVADCRACHLFIARDRPEIVKLTGYWEKKEPIPWVRVYSLPDHVYFPHMMHLRAKLACSTCHGEVATMDRITRTVGLRMGWCLNCHRQHKASIDCWTCHK